MKRGEQIDKSKPMTFLLGVLTLILTAILCLVTVAPTFANGDMEEEKAKTEKPSIVKKLTMIEGITTPAVDFAFTFTGISVDGKGDYATILNMPPIPQIIINFKGGEEGNTDNGIKTVINQSEIALDSVVFLNDGIYVYEVKETKDESGKYKFSDAKYSFIIDIQNGEKIINQKVEKCDSEDQKEGEKVKQMASTNKYINPTIIDPNSHKLSISKTVNGGDQDKYFEFKVRISYFYDNTFMAYVVNNSNEYVTTDLNYTNLYKDNDMDTNNNYYIKFMNDQYVHVFLKNGQSLVFTDVPDRASWRAIEKAVEQYRPSVKVVDNGSKGGADADFNQDLDTFAHTIGKNENSATFTNTHKGWIPSTGVVINNRPFINLLFLTAVTLIGLMVVKFRKNIYLNSQY